MVKINNILSDRKVIKDQWDYVSSFLLLSNTAYANAFLDIILDIQQVGFYRKPKQVIKISRGYGYKVLSKTLSHLIDCRVIVEQEHVYTRGDNFRPIFKKNIKIKGRKKQALIFTNITDDNGKKYKKEFEHESYKSIYSINEFNLKSRFTLNGQIIDPTMIRIFGEDETELGRFYGKFQRLSGEKRKQIRIDDHEAVELDYSQMHINLLFKANNLEVPLNLYSEVFPKSREKGKLAVCIALYTNNSRTAIKAIKHHLKISSDEAIEVFNRISQYPLIFQDRFYNRARRIMRLESEIALRIMEMLIKQGIQVLCVHDSFIVKKSHEGALAEAMEFHLKPEIIMETSARIGFFLKKSTQTNQYQDTHIGDSLLVS